MWQGLRHGLHYRDHIKLLSSRLHNITGGAYTVYPFKNDGHWSLSFEIRVTGDLASPGDGVLVSLGSPSLPGFSMSLVDSDLKITDQNFTAGLQNVKLQDAPPRSIYVLSREQERSACRLQR